MQGIRVRSRAQIIEDDEKPTNYFCNLEKHNYSSEIIPKLDTDDGKTITDQFEILNETKKFYEDLYSCKDLQLIDINLHDILHNLEVNTLNFEESTALEGLVSLQERIQD